ncbi:hypothetical protein LR48_Vigan484s000600 [Vigna angularis]|uniref:Uncharacterized protein n=1 Tax=Phaseolus angularis TaxID=3914 RepID=A0A0L9TBN8_PHAAN|nr:hypothetical protein LR48_Vigan484s000600 [Vigna angularis]
MVATPKSLFQYISFFLLLDRRPVAIPVATALKAHFPYWLAKPSFHADPQGPVSIGQEIPISTIALKAHFPYWLAKPSFHADPQGPVSIGQEIPISPMTHKAYFPYRPARSSF